MSCFLLLVTLIAKCHSMDDERTRLYFELDRIDNEIWRLSVTQNELVRNKTRILRELKELDLIKATAPKPTQSPTFNPTNSPSKSPTAQPTFNPTNSPTGMPSKSPTQQPTTLKPTHSPTKSPTPSPTIDTSPMKKPKLQNSARRRKENESAKNKLDDDLLEAAMQSKKKNVVQLYMYDDTPNADTKALMDSFESNLMNDPSLDLIIIEAFIGSNMEKPQQNTEVIGQATDIFLGTFIDGLVNRIYTRTMVWSSMVWTTPKLADYVQNGLQRLASVNFGSFVLRRVLDRLNTLPQSTKLRNVAFIHYINDHGYRNASYPKYDSDTLPAVANTMLHFLQFMLQEVVSYKIREALGALNSTEYGQSGKVPKKYEVELSIMQQNQYVEHSIADLFYAASVDNSSDVYMACEHLKRALQILEIMTNNFQIGNIIYRWKQKQSGNCTHQAIAISVPASGETNQINEFLKPFGYDASSIERYKIFRNTKSKKKDQFVAAPYFIPDTIHEDLVRVVKYSEGDVYMSEKQLFEANDPRNDLVLVLDYILLGKAGLTDGRFSIISEFDVQCAKLMNIIATFLKKIDYKQFGVGQKMMARVLVSSLIFPLTSLDRSIFDAIEEDVYLMSDSEETKQFCKMIRLGYDLMKSCGKYKELKMIQVDNMNAAMLDAIFCFIEAAIKEVFAGQIIAFSEACKGDDFSKQRYGEMRQLFVANERTLRSFDADLSTLSKFMKKVKKKCIGGTDQSDRRGSKDQIALPEILNKMNEFRIHKWLLTMGNILIESKKSNEMITAYVAYDHIWSDYFSDDKMTRFLHFIGFKNVGIVDETAPI